MPLPASGRRAVRVVGGVKVSVGFMGLSMGDGRPACRQEVPLNMTSLVMYTPGSSTGQVTPR